MAVHYMTTAGIPLVTSRANYDQGFLGGPPETLCCIFYPADARVSMCGLLGQQSDDITGALLSLWLVKRAIPQLHSSFLPTSFAGQSNAVLYKSLGSAHRPVRKNARISSGGASSAAGPQFGAALLSVFCIYTVPALLRPMHP